MPPIPHTPPHSFPSSNPNLIHTINCQFVDNTGRTLLLRGVNLSGASKNPVGQLSWKKDGFWEGVEEDCESDEGREGRTSQAKPKGKQKFTFVGRPLNLDDGSADIHLARLRGWGFNVLRFPFTWEALEHEGPGIYDYEYIDYTIRVLAKCSDYGFKIFMDPHQDTWSRFSGGDGAPFWTLAACGINPHNLTATQASILHNEYPTPQSPNPAALPAMIWSTNYGRLLSQTLFTLFFAGRSYAPKCIIDGLNIQDWLQSHYINACGVLADRISKFENGRLLDDCVIGWDNLNEPFEGFCGWEDLNMNPKDQGSTLKKGTFPTPAQSLRLGMGMKQTVENWSFGKMGPARDGEVTIDPKGLKMWAEPINPDGINALQGELPDGRHTKWGWKRNVQSWPLGTCIWALHGVWDIETGYILRPDYFKFKYDISSSSSSSSSLQLSPNAIIQSDPVEFLIDHWKPHFIAYAKRIRQSHPLAILFIQPPVFAPPPPLPESTLQGRCAYAPHYYDGLTLVTRHWNWFNADALGLIRGKYGHGMWSSLRAVKIGESTIRKSLQEQLGYLKDDVGLISAYADHDDDNDENYSVNEDPSPPHPTPHPKYPTLIGEIGTPFDMDSKKSYGYTDKGKYTYDYTSQTKALDASLNGCDGGNGLSWTVWGYVPDDHTWEWGDGWNMEDLSLWSWGDWREEEKDDQVEGEDGMNGRVVLLNQPAESMPMVVTSSSSKIVASSSSLSLSSSSASSSSISGIPRLRSSASASAPSYTLPSCSGSQLDLKGYSANPYDFLTNGARAVQAFARPWPTKVVGKPVDITFDVGQGVFRLEVEVRKGDGVPLGRSGVRKRGGNGEGGKEMDVRVVPVDDNMLDEAVEAKERKRGAEEQEHQLATEIYIPLVHYAHPKVLEGSWMAGGGGRSKNRSDGGDTQSVRSLGAKRRGVRDAAPAGNSMADSAVSSSSSLLTTSTSTLTPPTDPTTNANMNPKHHHSKIINKSMDSTPDLVDIQVEVSGGKWSVCGQTLKWWYDLPVPSSRSGSNSETNLGGSEETETDDEPVKKYTIEIKRRGGPIKISSNERGLGDEGLDREKERERECCEELCEGGRGCLVM
ncbi:hypothetical protein BYT27DRAFT_7235714 [Phlegmacium glaucopus]|nr:hypothetical protein BYT27DRAFT_7235714 [Phlegmacium glaucopus]